MRAESHYRLIFLLITYTYIYMLLFKSEVISMPLIRQYAFDTCIVGMIQNG